MPASAVWVLLLSGLGLAALGTTRQSFAVLTATWLFVPGLARPPGVATGQLFIHRLVLLAVLIGLVRGLLAGRLDRRILAPRAVHHVVVAYLAIALVVGMVLADVSVPAETNTNRYLVLVEKAVFFAAALALIRAIGARAAAAIVSVGAGLVAAVALVEALFAWSYSQWLTAALVDEVQLMSLPLQLRGGEPRVRVAALFALEFGWMCALLVPVTAAVALTRRSRAWWLPPIGLTAALVLTWSRSPYLGLAVGLGVVLLARGRPTLRGVAALGAAAAAGVLVVVPALQQTIDEASPYGEQDVRLQRLPEVLELSAHRPAVGLGLGGLVDEGVTVVDNAWVNAYANIGVVGVVTLAAVLLALILSGLAFVRARPGPTRTLAIGATGGLVAVPLGLAAFDFEHIRGSSEAMWMLGALAIAANEEVGALPPCATLPSRARVRAAVGWAVCGALAGALVVGLVPERHSATFLYSQAAPPLALSGSEPNADEVLGRSACSVVEEIDVTPAAEVRCQSLDHIPGGFGRMRIEASSSSGVRDAVAEIEDTMRRAFPAWQTYGIRTGHGRPAWATTSPVWLAALAGALSLGVSARRERQPPSVSGRNSRSRPPGRGSPGDRPPVTRAPSARRTDPDRVRLRAVRPRHGTVRAAGPTHPQ